MAEVLGGVVEGWSARHVGELLAMLYFRGDQPVGQRREAWDVIRRLPRLQARQTVEIIQQLTNCAINET
jgi:hypothetical protein